MSTLLAGNRLDQSADTRAESADQARRFNPRALVRRTIPLLFLPLCLVASALAASPWLRSFPSSVAAAPLFGAAVLSVLVPLVTAMWRPRWLWLGFLVDVAAFVIYTLVVVLHDPRDVGALVEGIYRGPSQLLTYALPLVSPRSLMVAPVALTWLAGAIAGECFGRRWFTLLPYAGFLVSFGLAYAATQRAAGSDLAAVHRTETVLAALLLITLLLMRVTQAWVHQDETAESTQPDGVLPLRGLVIGAVSTLVIAAGASLLVQTTVFPGQADAPQRVPSVNQSERLTPLAFIASLRPRTEEQDPRKLFSVVINNSAPGYFPIANVDFYDGSGWTFDRTFRPSGGVLPDDLDAGLRGGRTVTQRYVISSPALTRAPWIPMMYRPSRITGTTVNIDPTSGMIVPASALGQGTSYSVVSHVDTTTFDRINAITSVPDSTTPVVNTELPPTLRTTLDRLVAAFSKETGKPTTPALPFLRALQNDLRNKYSLSPAARAVATGTPAQPTPTPTPTPTPPGSSSSGSSSSGSSSSGSTHPSGKHPATGQPPGGHSRTARHPSHPASGHPSRPTGGQSSSGHSSPPPRHTGHGHRPQSVAVRPLAAPPGSRARTATTTPIPTPTPTSTAPPASTSSGPGASDQAGGTGFAEVLASVLGQRNGTPEQFATLVALVARDLGVPARVATGFRVLPQDGGSLLQSGSYQVTSADAWSWVEVPVVGSGWVVLDASPSRYQPSNQPTRSGAEQPTPSSAPPTQNAAQLTQGNNGHAVAAPSAVPHTVTSASRALIVALATVFGLLLAVLLLVFSGRKPLRAARRKRSPDPRTRLIGAWQESLDMLTEAGLPDLQTMTSAEIADLAGNQFGPRSQAEATSLGTAANAVAYSAHTRIAARDADAAWERHRVLRREVRAQLGLRGRVMATVRYHHPAKDGRPVSPPSWAVEAEERAKRHTGRRRYRGRRRKH